MSLKVAGGKQLRSNVQRATSEIGVCERMWVEERMTTVMRFFSLGAGGGRDGETIPEWDNISAGWEEMSQEFLCRSLPGREKSKRQAGRPTAYKTMFMEKHMAHLEAVVIQHGGSQSRE